MRSNSFQTRVLLNAIYSAIITCVVEVILVLGFTALAESISQTDPTNPFVMGMEDMGISTILLFVLFGIVLFVISFWLLQRKAFSYVTTIQNAVEEIANGNLNTTIEVEEDDEFSDIAMNLNSMTDRLRELIEKERKSEKSKNELITNIAHDLRTPLTSIIGYLELLSIKKDLPADVRDQYINVAYTKSKRLYKLIEDLFGFTKLSYGKMAMKLEQLDIVKLLEQLIEEFYPNFAEKNLTYNLISNESSCIITADGTLIARLFDNLVNNAIKYGADGKHIDVKIECKHYTVVVSVINYGNVIPAEELPHVFEKFYRVEQSRSTKTGGTGLGLAIAKDISEMHGGKIEAFSDMEGTRFVVTLQKELDLNKENFNNV